MAESACLTCNKTTDPGSSEPIGTNENIQRALSKHFWFTEDESHHRVLCQLCWEKIYDFHRFYCEVEQMHCQPESQIAIQFLSVKQEPFQPEEAAEPLSENSPEPSVKKEAVDKDDEDEDYDDDNDVLSAYDDNEESANFNEASEKGESSEDTNKTPKGRKKRIRPRKRPPQPVSEQFIADHINLECDTCSSKFATFTDLQKHSTAQHEKLAYVFCCDFKFCRKPRLIDHMLYHLNPNQFQCDKCSRHFLNRESLKRHTASVHVSEPETVFKCSYCTKIFKRAKVLQVHEKYHRKLSEKKWHCAECDKYFAYESLLQNHNQRKHLTGTDQEFMYVCHVCAKGFQTMASYTLHVESHNENFKRVKQPSEVERVQCTECGIWLYRKGLRNHMMRHTGSCTCEHCGQECKSLKSLQYHRAQHQKADIVCSVCGKVFKQQISLKEHMTSHTGEVLYRCDFCEKTFNSKANRAAHRKKMHPKEWLEEKLRKNPNLEAEQGPLLRQLLPNFSNGEELFIPQMNAPICLTCTKTLEQDSPVIVCDHEDVKTALFKHFWFREEIIESTVLCRTCWSKIDDFHRFYCDIKRVHLSLKIVPIPLDVEEEKYDSQSEDDNTNETGQRSKYASDHSETVVLKENQIRTTRQKPKKTNNRVGRPVKSWQKSIKDEEFIGGNINLECDTCSVKYNTFQELQKHSLAQHKKRAYVFCCDRKFTRKPRLIDHIQFHLNPAQFRCVVCSRQFQHSEALKAHTDKMHNESEQKTLQCSVCPKTFSQRKFLNIHEKYHRKMNEKRWHCDSCDRYFAYESMLRQHIRVIHLKECKYVCYVCAKEFQVLSSYTAHLASHDEDGGRERPPEERVPCSKCDSLVLRKSLRRHLLRHTGSQKCESCGHECKSVMALRYHKAQHRKGDLSCSLCGKAFKRQITLKEHMASHTGEVLYNCDFCEKTFNSHANRAAHRKKMHPREWLEDKMRKKPNLQSKNGE
ncbi:zinc finger protein 271-like [Topomyia yanbarensis]|uniref:zinc finger protein 271-like n=1 Tax=Topomyia yanbarensis TaxID=2498891 RepID=UPI00273C83D0|nr:zinc finger protein 271-like [Topomyia yanbarensis]